MRTFKRLYAGNKSVRQQSTAQLIFGAFVLVALIGGASAVNIVYMKLLIEKVFLP